MVKKSGRWHDRLDRLLAQSSYAELKDDRLGRASCSCHYSLQFQPSPSRKSNFRRPFSGPSEQTAAEQGFGLFGPRISRVLLHDHPSIIPASLRCTLDVDASNGQGIPRIRFFLAQDRAAPGSR